MQLVFEVCEAAGVSPASTVRKVFDGVGGVIGRGSGCDWVIHDPSRLLSSHHALVGCREGRYFLTDISSNGIGMPGSGERLRKGQARLIEEGDVFELGTLSIRARLIEPAQPFDELPISTGIPIPDDAFLALDPLQALDLEHQRHSVSDELAALSAGVGELGAWADRYAADREHVAMPRRVDPLMEMPVAESVAMAASSDEAFWIAFAAALGLDLDRLDSAAREALAIKVARLFRLEVERLQSSLRTCEQLQGELATLPVDALRTAHNPLHNCVDTDAALTAILDMAQVAPLSGEQAIAQAHRALQVHQVALLSACRSTLRNARAAFAPGHLLACAEFQEAAPRWFSDGARWRAYLRHYRRLAADEQSDERPLGNDFVRAYEEQVRLISTLHNDYPG
ncbi:type VI secretion system-associated FHA domain protein TagH [Pseudomonas sp. CFBP13528]|uniref:type VI secretion system-associated FHA domain protein TagH n=1 Tax=Pseudomonas sp. CFBP13528 TaxID=2184006 RepID=UPI0010BF99C1|nr:type VI secretion system-associated FHA domain protein TagH [Pseudomonas sp. CFBP13528]TKK28382.1 type VI secretion system-associated FHA domain protein TagH [Pseudomonas sp. CFBP13528]